MRDLVKKTGHVPKGKTTAALLDEFEDNYTQGSADPAAIAQAVEDYIEANHGGLSDEDMAEIFGEL